MQDTKNCQKFTVWAPPHNFVGLYLRNYGTYRQSERKLAKQQYLPYMSPQYGELRPSSVEVAEILSLVWGTQANFKWVSLLGSVTARHLVVGVSQTLWR